VKSVPRDYSVFNKLNLERKPVGVKFTAIRPAGIQRLSKGLYFCELLKEAQTSQPFYIQQEDMQCLETVILGMKEPEPFLTAGLVGETDDFFEEARANRKLYQFLPCMPKGSVRFVVFSSFDQLTFDPDVMVITAPAEQARPVMRAVSFSSGEAWSSKGTQAAACSWLYVYPVLSGEVNYTVTGLSLGMQALKVFPPGLMLISIPWTRLPNIMENLQKMNLTIVSDQFTGEEHKKRVGKLFAELEQKMRD
jgi:uncharacterized protein (DUF169 family)